MKNKIILLIIFSVLIYSSCCKKKLNNKFILKNESTEKILIIGFKNGIQFENQVVLLVNDTFEIKTKILTNATDSIHVFIGGKKYSNINPYIPINKLNSLPANMNLYIRENFEIKVVNNTDCLSEVEYLYTFKK
jgi:hypothetical protein